MEKTELKKAPVVKYQVGGIFAAIWENNINGHDGNVIRMLSATIERRYKDGEEWKSTNSFKANDLPKLALIANKCYAFMNEKGEFLQE